MTLANATVRAAVRIVYRRQYRAFLEATKEPRAAQTALLRRIVAANADTDFGREHGFSRIETMADLRAAVPVQDYEALRPYVERQERSGDRCLTAAPPVYYQRTSGTLGKPKDIPVTAAGLRRIHRNQQLLTRTLALGTRAFEGKVFGITGQAVEGRMAGGTATARLPGSSTGSTPGWSAAAMCCRPKPPISATTRPAISPWPCMASPSLASPVWARPIPPRWCGCKRSSRNTPKRCCARSTMAACPESHRPGP